MIEELQALVGKEVSFLMTNASSFWGPYEIVRVTRDGTASAVTGFPQRAAVVVKGKPSSKGKSSFRMLNIDHIVSVMHYENGEENG